MTDPPTPAERLGMLLGCVSLAATTQSLMGRLANAVVRLLLGRFQVIRERFERLVARIQAGTYRPRRFARRRPPASRKPRQSSLLPQNFGWVIPLVVRSEGFAYRSQLEYMLRDPEMVRLIEAAPAAMGRALRPLCWALHLKPPPILARQRAAEPQAPAPAAAATKSPPRRPHPQARTTKNPA